jgi:hypothetical protein
MPSDEIEPENDPTLDPAQAEVLEREIVAATRVLFGLASPAMPEQPGEQLGQQPNDQPAPGQAGPIPEAAPHIAEDSPGLVPEAAAGPPRLRAVPYPPISAPSVPSMQPPAAIPLPDEVTAGADVATPEPVETPGDSAHGAGSPPAALPVPGGIPVPEAPEPQSSEPDPEPSAEDPSRPTGPPPIAVPGQTDKPRRDRRSLEMLQEIAFLDE